MPDDVRLPITEEETRITGRVAAGDPVPIHAISDHEPVVVEHKEDGTVIPIVEEVASVSTHQVTTDHVRVRTVVEEKQTDVVAQIAREELIVERRQAEREVAAPPPPVEQGDTLIVSVVEERLVVEKRLFVIEELVVRRVANTEEVRIPTTLKTMRAVVEQDSAQP